MALFSLLAQGFLPSNPDHWNQQVLLGELGAIVIVSWVIGKHIHILAGLTFLWFGGLAVYCMFPPNGQLQFVFSTYAGRSFVMLLLVVSPFVLASKRQLENWETAFFYFAIVDSFVMIFNFVRTGAATGLVGMDSVDGSFLAVLAPLLIYKVNRSKFDAWFLFPPFLALTFSRSSTVFGIVCLEILIFISRRNWKHALAVVSAIPLIGHFYLQDQLLNDNGRQGILLKSWAVFHQAGHYLTGLGTGSFITILPLMQEGAKFVWLHNEPAQVLFEQGVIGLTLLVAMYIMIMWKQRHNEALFLSLAAAGFQSFLQPCFRYFPFALLMVFLARFGFEKQDSFNSGYKGGFKNG